MKLFLAIQFILQILGEFLIVRFCIKNFEWGYLAVGCFLGLNFCMILISDIMFRIFYRMKFGISYKIIKKVPINKIHIESHPYLPYVYKENFATTERTDLMYPLHKGRFKSPKLKTGNLYHNDGLDGSRKMVPKNSRNELKIVCLGASTTGNYIQENEEVCSYPIFLEEKLKSKLQDRHVVVHNCGQGGWTSAEVFINFSLKIVDLKPDVVVIYHAYNDLQAGLTPGYKSDYSHYRRNFGEVVAGMKFSRFIPNIPLASLNFLYSSIFPWINPRFGLLQCLRKGSPDLSRDFESIPTLKRNIEHIIHICEGRGIKVVLSTFANFLYEGIEASKVHRKYAYGLELENNAILDLAETYNIPIVDNRKLIPSEEKYFVDSIHFTPEGMNLLASNFVQPILDAIK